MIDLDYTANTPVDERVLAGLAVPGAMTLLWWAARLFGGDRL